MSHSPIPTKPTGCFAAIEVALDGVARSHEAGILAEVVAPLLADLRRLEDELQREFIASRAVDRSYQTVEWFAQNAKKIARVTEYLEHLLRQGAAGDGVPA